MLTATVRNFIGRFSPHPTDEAELAFGPDPDEPSPVVPQAGPEDPPEVPIPWPAPRLALAHQLWGPGFIFPGGEIETLHLARPLGASSATSLLMVGVGSGGPASVAARNLGTWVTGFESDPSLLASARTLMKRAQVGKKVSLRSWNRENPDFVTKSHHQCLAFEPLRGAQPEPILDGLARALKPGGQLVMTELTATAPLDLEDPYVRRWADLEARNPADIPAGVAVTRMLGRVGLDVRIAEDISPRHLEQALLGWRLMLQELRTHKPTRQQAATLVAEAELWLLRRRMIRDGRLRMMRWHAFSRIPIA